MTIVKAYQKLKSIQNKIDLYETLRTTKTGIKASNLTDIILKKTALNNSAIINALLGVDEYTIILQKLYKEKNTYELYIITELDDAKIDNPGLAIAFLKDYLKLKWKEITPLAGYSDKQTRRYYDVYKGRTPQENVLIKDDQL